MQKSLDDETREILISFIAEGYERLDDSEAQLAKIGEGDNTAELNSVFRLFHSVKGSAGFLGLENIKNLTHEAETLLDVFLKEKMPVTQDSLDVVYTTIDVLRALIETVEKEYSDETGAESAAAQTKIVSATIRQLREGANAQQSQEEANTREKTPEFTPEISQAAAPAIPATVPACAIPNEITLSDLVTRDMVHRFLGECADLADRTEKIALALSIRKMPPTESGERHVSCNPYDQGKLGVFRIRTPGKHVHGSRDHSRYRKRKSDKPVGEAFVNTVISGIDRVRLSLSSLVIHEKDESAQSSPENTSEKMTAANVGQSQSSASAEGSAGGGIQAARRNSGHHGSCQG